MRCKVLKENTVDLRCAINVELHPGRCNDILDITRDITNPAAVLDAQGFHTRRDSQADRVLRSVWVSNYQIGFHGIQATGDAFDGGIIAFLIDHKVLRRHLNPSPYSFLFRFVQLLYEHLFDKSRTHLRKIFPKAVAPSFPNRLYNREVFLSLCRPTGTHI